LASRRLWLREVVNPMQSARQFIEGYLSKQVHFYEVAAKALQAGPGLFGVEQAKAEVVLESSESKRGAVVTTSGQGEGYAMRYILRREAEGWCFKRVQKECGICRITERITGKLRNENCEYCRGGGWWPVEDEG
jgi:hypothetical protein